MKLSFVYISNRPGSIDLLASCLSGQIPVPGAEHELIVIDGYPGRIERRQAEAFLRSQGINLHYYGPPKARTFPWSRTGFTNAMNTGIMHATGDYCVFLHDFMLIPANAVHNLHALLTGFHDDKTLLCQSAIMYDAPAPSEVDDIQSMIQGQWAPVEPWVPEVFDIAYWLAPTKFFEVCNGIDERADFCAMWALDCVMAQAKFHGYKCRVERAMVCHMINHRKWHTGRADESSLYQTFGGSFTTEAADIPVKPLWTAWSANDFNMVQVRRQLGSCS